MTVLAAIPLGLGMFMYGAAFLIRERIAENTQQLKRIADILESKKEIEHE